MGVTAMSPPVPPLPADTAGKWLPIVREDVDMVRRFLNVMYQMDKGYLAEDVTKFGIYRGHRPEKMGASYYYWTAKSEVVLRIGYHDMRKQHRITSVGFVGSLAPQAALDLVVDQIIVFLKWAGGRTAMALVPKRMDNPRILELYALAPKHPRMRIKVEKESDLAARWNMEFPELAP
jgi:hypothetical protein